MRLKSDSCHQNLKRLLVKTLPTRRGQGKPQSEGKYLKWISDKGFEYRTYKELPQNKTRNNPVKNAGVGGKSFRKRRYTNDQLSRCYSSRRRHHFTFSQGLSLSSTLWGGVCWGEEGGRLQRRRPPRAVTCTAHRHVCLVCNNQWRLFFCSVISIS